MPESIGLGGTIIAISASLTFLSGIFLGLRLYCKLVRCRGFWWDDHVLIAAWICLVICVVLTIVDVSLGFGKDISNVNPANVPAIALTGTVYGLFGCLAVAWSKTSFALTLLRLESGWKYWFLWFLIITMNIIMTLVIVFSFVKCTSARKVWHSSLPGTCWNPLVATYYNVFAGAYLGLVDLILCIFAWTIIWKLSMRTREKIGVGIALTFGIFAAAAAGAKCFGMLGLSSPNRTLDRAGIFIWSTVEISVTIMAASIPIMRILVLRVCRRNRHQISNRPLRRLRTISSRDKRPSANVRTSSDNNNTGAGEVSAREDGLSNVTLIPSIDSIRRNDIDMYRMDTTLSVV